MASVALMILPLAHFFVPGERMNKRKVLGFITGFFGVVLLIGGNLFESSGSDQEFLGRLALIAAPAGYATSSIVLRRMPPINAFGLAAWVMIIGACASVPIAFVTDGPPKVANIETFWVIAVLGLVHTALANLFRIIVVRGAGPTFMSLTSYQVPVWSVLMGAWVLHEPVPNTLLMALILILIGIVITQYGALKRLFFKTAD
jgi:drug/metabolite transporter (DMT)-like permease